MRANGQQVKGRSLWWSSLNRNKKLMTLDLRQPAGQAVALRLAAQCDVVVENFRAGQLEKWNLGWDAIQKASPRTILVRISGYGQSGPYSQRVAFAPIAEAAGGLTFVTGGADAQPPVRPNISLGDSITGLNAMGMLMAAIYERDTGGTGKGRCIDIAMFESVFSMMDAAVTEYSVLGSIRKPSASTVVFAPSGSFRAADGSWIFITASGNAVYHRLAHAMGQPELATDPRFLENADRVANRTALDASVSEWVGRHGGSEAEALLNRASVPASKVFSMADCVADPHFQHRGAFLPVEDPNAGPLLHPPIAAKFDAGGSQPSVRWAGGALGEATTEILGDILSMSPQEIAALAAAQVI